MAYTNVHASAVGTKIKLNQVDYQVRRQPGAPVIKGGRNASQAPWILGLLRSGVSMISTIISALILLVLSVVFKGINAKQSEFDKLEAEHR